MDQLDQQKRLLLTIVISTVVMIVWFQFFAPKPPMEAAADAGALAVAALDGSQLAAPLAPDAGGAELAVTPPAPEKLLDLTTEAHQLTFTNKGGGLAKALVEDVGNTWPERKTRSREKDASGKLLRVDLVRPHPGLDAPGATELKGEIVLHRGVAYEAEKTEDGVVFRAVTPQVVVEKRYRVHPKAYELRLEVKVTNRSGAPKRVDLSLAYPAWIDPKTEKSGGMFSPPPEVAQVICRHESSSEMLVNGTEDEHKNYPGPVRFAGFDERYFMGVFFPRFEQGTTCTLQTKATGEREARIDTELGVLGADQTATREFGLYLGPKEFNELERVSAANAAGMPLTGLGQPVTPGTSGVGPQLTEAIDFGWWAVI
ncbi:MAG: membrane protein insertase YidC, partial [Deltaproteobacteria bacterium]|nr:membrane protein insertase YidC [Deltaproteobacteria bacterium]